MVNTVKAVQKCFGPRSAPLHEEAFRESYAEKLTHLSGTDPQVISDWYQMVQSIDSNKKLFSANSTSTLV